jgi:ketosteroid isomerase-like protein
MSALTEIRDRHYYGVANTDLDIGAAVFAPNVENLLPGSPPGSANGLEGWKHFAARFFDAFSGVEIDIVKSLEMDGTIMAEGVMTAGQTAALEFSLGMLPATGRRAEIPYVDIFRVRDGRAVSHHVYFDLAGLMAQLGATAAPVG